MPLPSDTDFDAYVADKWPDLPPQPAASGASTSPRRTRSPHIH